MGSEGIGGRWEILWDDCILSLCGVVWFHRKTVQAVVTGSPERGRAWLDEGKEIAPGRFRQGGR